MKRMPRGWWLGLAGACALAITLLVAGHGGRSARIEMGPPGLPAPAGLEVGVSVNRLFNDPDTLPAQRSTQLAALEATHASVARSDALWEFTEPAAPTNGAHRYDWSFDDHVAGSLAQHGLRWLPILDYSAGWDRRDAAVLHSPPRDPAFFAAFAAALVGRYGSRGAFWTLHPELTARPVNTLEVWNEPDSGVFWSPAPDPAAYAALYLTTRAAVDAVDPGTRTIIGGLTSPDHFLPALLAAAPQLSGHLDGIGIHPYAPTPAEMLDKVRLTRAAADALHLGAVPLYLTEFGWATHPPGNAHYVPGSLRPAYIRQALATLSHTDCGIAALILYTWETPERNLADTEDWFGIHPPGGGPSSDVEAFKAGIRQTAISLPRTPCR